MPDRGRGPPRTQARALRLLEVQSLTARAKLKTKGMCCHQAERIRTLSRRVGGDRKAAAPAGADQCVDFRRGDRRQIRRQHHHVPATEFVQHPMGLGERTVEALAAVGEHGDLGGHRVALRADHDDLTHRLRAARSRQHRGEHGSYELEACPRRQRFRKPCLAVQTLLDRDHGAGAAPLIELMGQIAKHRQTH